MQGPLRAPQRVRPHWPLSRLTRPYRQISPASPPRTGDLNTLLYDLSYYDPSANAWANVSAAGAAPAAGISNMGFAAAANKIYLFGGSTSGEPPSALSPSRGRLGGDRVGSSLGRTCHCSRPHPAPSASA